ncbi:MAG: hypothetical protein COB04_03785 [Gammaproteobacteria bacterium]|nr:MAG: hypothetical protein COB04_03785 [Gammaproteobacteria bacterium]
MSISPLAASAVFKGIDYLSNVFKKPEGDKKEGDSNGGLFNSIDFSPQAHLVNSALLDVSLQLKERFGSSDNIEEEDQKSLFDFISQQVKEKLDGIGIDLDQKEITDAIKDNLKRLESGELKSTDFVATLKVELDKFLS